MSTIANVATSDITSASGSKVLPVELVVLLLAFLPPDIGVQLANVNRWYRKAIKTNTVYWQQACRGLTLEDLGEQVDWYSCYIQLKRLYWAWQLDKRIEYSLHPNLPALWLSMYELVAANEQWAVVASGRPLRLFLVPIGSPAPLRDDQSNILLKNLAPAPIELALPPPPTQPRLVARHLLAPTWGVISGDYLVVRTPRDRFFPSIPPCLLVWRISNRQPLRWVPLGFADTRRTFASGRWLLSTLGGGGRRNNMLNSNVPTSVERTFLLDMDPGLSKPINLSKSNESYYSSSKSKTKVENYKESDQLLQDEEQMTVADEEHSDYWRPVASFSEHHCVIFLPDAISTKVKRLYNCHLLNHAIRWSVFGLTDQGKMIKLDHGTLEVKRCIKTVMNAIIIDEHYVLLTGQCEMADYDGADEHFRETSYVIVHNLKSNSLSRLLPGYKLVYPPTNQSILPPSAAVFSSSPHHTELSTFLLSNESTGKLATTTVCLDRFRRLPMQLPANYLITPVLPSIILLTTNRFRYLFNLKTMRWQVIDNGTPWVASTLAGSGRCLYLKGSTLRVMDYRPIQLPKQVDRFKGVINRLSSLF